MESHAGVSLAVMAGFGCIVGNWWFLRGLDLEQLAISRCGFFLKGENV